MQNEIPDNASAPEPPPQDMIDSAYQQSLQHFQNGEWSEAMAGFEKVLRLSPDHAEAKAFLEETRLKASLDQEKPRVKRPLLSGRARRLVTALAFIGVLVLLAAGGVYAYGRWVKPARDAQSVQAQRLQRLQDARKYLGERDYANAATAFKAVLGDDPENEEAKKGLAESETRLAIAADYSSAVQAIDNRQWDDALRLLASVLQRDPNYRDAKQKQALAETQKQLANELTRGETAFSASNWSEAIAAFEGLRNLDSAFEKQRVTQRLFDSYLRQGAQLVQSVKENPDPVKEAKTFFQKALALIPQQQQAVQELALADKYLEAQGKLAQGDSVGALTALDWISQQRADYANGSVAALIQKYGAPTPTVSPPAPVSTPTAMGQAVPTPTVPPVQANFRERYADLIQKGDEALVAKKYAGAVDLYTQATMVAIHGGTDSARWLFAAYVRLGTANARLGNSSVAAQQLNTALTIIAKAATAIPTEAYADSVAAAEQSVQKKDFASAFAEYDKAVRAVSSKCNCGLDNWKIMP